jgi:hypothetical protein
VSATRRGESKRPCACNRAAAPRTSSTNLRAGGRHCAITRTWGSLNALPVIWGRGVGEGVGLEGCLTPGGGGLLLLRRPGVDWPERQPSAGGAGGAVTLAKTPTPSVSRNLVDRFTYSQVNSLAAVSAAGRGVRGQ